MTPQEAQIEDLQEALRRIICVLGDDGRHLMNDRDHAALVIATDVLELDPPIVLHPLRPPVTSWWEL